MWEADEYLPMIDDGFVSQGGQCIIQHNINEPRTLVQLAFDLCFNING